MSDAYEQVEVTSADRAADLAARPTTTARRGIWLVTYKKAAGEQVPAVRRHRPRGALLGLDRQQGPALDELRSQLLLTPRKPTSKWSRPNKQRIAELEASGRMAAPGRAVVEAAKASGTWTALDDVENLVEPAELTAALDADAGGPEELGRLPALDPPGHAGVDRRRQAAGHPRAAGSPRPSSWPRRTSGAQCQRAWSPWRPPR